jgi:signal transduction histidine kinase
LPPEFQPRAFDRLHRAEHARSRETGGTGLGLSIVRAIAEAHGGTADIVNRPEGGACAMVQLPPVQDPGVPKPALLNRSALTGTSHSSR